MLPHLNSWQDDNDNDALSDEEDGEDMQFQDGGTDEDEGAFAGGRKMRALAMSMKVCVCKFGFNNEYERL